MTAAQETEQAANILRFLVEVQRLRQKPEPSFRTQAESKDAFLFLNDVPQHDNVQVGFGRAEAGDVVARFSRTAVPPPPAVPDQLQAWIAGPTTDPKTEPQLKEESVAVIAGEDVVLRLEDHAAVQLEARDWLEQWNDWSEVAKPAAAAQELYERFFRMNNKLQGAQGQLELVLGVGLVSGQLTEAKVERHLAVVPLDLEFSSLDAGDISVIVSGPVSVEDDFVDTQRLGDPRSYKGSKEALGVYAADELLTESGNRALATVGSQLSPRIQFSESWSVPSTDEGLSLSLSPMLLLRGRRKRSLIAFLERAATAVEQADAVPPGLMPLVDVALAPPSAEGWGEGEGAMVDVGNDEYLAPLPLNDKQLRIIQSASSKAQTVVQGPPGTGKTHTSAALISHFLALGKRVLITAQTDQALTEIRDKLPAEIRDLAVASIGKSRQQLNDLSTSINKINTQIEHFDHAEYRQQELELVERIDELRRSRSLELNRLRHARLGEVHEIEICGVSMPPARHAEWLIATEPLAGWISDVPTTDDPPLDDHQFAGLLQILADPRVSELADEAKSAAGIRLPTSEQFQQLIDAHETALKAHQQCVAGQLVATDKSESYLLSVAARMTAGYKSPEASFWASGFGGYFDRDPLASSMLHDTRAFLARFDDFDRSAAGRSVSCEGDSIGLIPYASSVEAFLEQGGRFKLGADGIPKAGLLAPAIAKGAGAFFESVRVNFEPPVDLSSVRLFREWAGLRYEAEQLSSRWGLGDGAEWKLAERVNALGSTVAAVDDASSLGGPLREYGNAIGLSPADMATPEALEASAKRLQLGRATTALRAAEDNLRTVADLVNEGSFRWSELLSAAAANRSTGLFAEAEARLGELREVAYERSIASDRLLALGEAAPKLAREVQQDGFRLHGGAFTQAWRHARTKAEIGRFGPTLAPSRVDEIDAQIRSAMSELARVRAWTHALSSERINQTTRADLVAYSALVKKVGKGTGKYAEQFSSEARKTLTRVRPAVPAWVMPLYRVWEQIDPAEGLFDVVVIDEASQAGVEAVCLQLLAPRIVVIGDDQQVSPDGVGVNQEKLSALARQYLPDDRFRATWEIPQRSLFDDAKMRYGEVITLQEHRRCAPSIIEFSNLIAYREQGIELTPVRQTKSALRPIRTTHVPNGYREQDVNKPEAEAIVQSLVDCCADSDYDGMSLGVITLQGSKQEKVIESMLLEKLPPEEWLARDLRVGKPASFQGSERDVIFASLVVDAGGSNAALTKLADIQRFNVAVSRAKDQFWLFHSLTAADIPNAECVRGRLLKYCAEAERSQATTFPASFTTPVSETEKTAPFDSLFEQRVFNRLVERGYVVEPQVSFLGRRLDLVVHGDESKVAVECDGDHWHGPDKWADDQRRQRSLESCGWEFIRIRESAFYLNQIAEIDRCVEILEERGVLVGAAPVEDRSGEAGRPDRESQGHLATSQDEEAATQDFVATDVFASVPTPEADVYSPQHGVSPGDGVELSTPSVSPERLGVVSDPIAPPLVPTVPSAGPMGSTQLLEYREWPSREIGRITELERAALAAIALEVIAIEGPIAVDRLYQVLNFAAGGSRTSAAIRSAINRALGTLDGKSIAIERAGDGYAGGWARQVSQPDVVLREIGPRSLEEVPPGELVEAMRRHVSGADSEEDVYRALMDDYGMSRLTEKRRLLFDAAYLACHSAPPSG